MSDTELNDRAHSDSASDDSFGERYDRKDYYEHQSLSRPDSGISVRDPIPVSPQFESESPKQLFSSTLMGKFLKPNLKKIFVEPEQPIRNRGHDAIQLEELEEPLRVRNGHSYTRPPPPLPTAPPPPPPKKKGRTEEETLLHIAPLPYTSTNLQSITLRTGEIPPPPSVSDDEEESRVSQSPDRPKQHPRGDGSAGSRVQHFLNREPGISSYQDFIYSDTHAGAGSPHLEYGLPTPEEYFSTRESRREYETTTQTRRQYESTPTLTPPPPRPTTSRGRSPTPLSSSHHAQREEDQPSSQRPRTATESLTDLLRQPLSLRIHIQKHKTETSYKKTVSKNSANDFSESSI